MSALTGAIRWPAVLFDLDGTLANSIDLIVDSYVVAMNEVLGYEAPRPQVLSWIGRSLPQVCEELAPGHGAELEAAYLSHNRANLEAITGYPGIPELLADLDAQGIQLGVVTSKRRDVAHLTMRLAGLPDELALVVGLEDSTAHKPDPEPLLVALKKLGADAEQVVYVGDAVTDLQAAAAAGLAGVGVTWGAGTSTSLEAAPNVGLADDAAQLRALLLSCV